MGNIQTAAAAYAAYLHYLETGTIAQRPWSDADGDGRRRADILGAIGVASPRDCPASIMPLWLAQMVTWFFDRQEFSDAVRWGAAFYAELARLDGCVPFSVVHDWHARVVVPLAIDIAERRGGDPEAHRRLADMQVKALTGQIFSVEEWRRIVGAAFDAAYAYACRYGGDLAYMGVDSASAARAYADAYAAVDPDAYADAFVHANADTERDAYAEAHIDADAFECADASPDCFDVTYANVYRLHMTRLAAGLLTCLARAERLSARSS